MAEAKTSEPINGPSGHELSDLSARNISFFGAGLAVLIIVALLASYGLIAWLRDGAARRAEPPSPLAVVPEPTAGPQLEIQPGRALKAMREQEEAHLKGYGWIDQEKGIAHIPIERAMEILVQKGVPARRSERDSAGDRSRAQRAASDRREPRP